MSLKNSNNGSQLSLYVNVRSRSKNFFEGTAKTVTSINQTGEFDILPLHANFITLIRDYVLIDKGMSVEKKIIIKSAVLSVIGGRIDVYVEV
jgi:F0F1-type ATP synthase epsilon subunit